MYLLRMSTAAQATDPRHDGQVTVDVHDAVATVEFFHPKGNSLPGALLRRLADEIGTVGRTPGVHIIVLRSAGSGAFCGGASFDEMKAVKNAAGGEEFFRGFARVILAMIRAPQFVVVRVHGKTAGGGVGLVAAADYALGVRGAAFRLSELALGLGPFVIGPVVERRVGRGPFTALAVDADWRDAEWGERHGMYARVFDDTDQLDAGLARLVASLARTNPDAIRRLKQVFWNGTEQWDELLEQRAAISGALVLSPHAQRLLASA